ncbi:MAG: hypothetical protein QOD55_2695 [Solirubrobacteraceae bacterium]|jgi:hypothetical protein|nr:hypothetical protein [Solirubrobacteraceae bacterium]
MSAVRPEFGPTLPELVGPRIASWPRAARLALAAAGALAVVALAVVLLARGGDDRQTVVVREPVAYNLLVEPSLRQVAPRGRETLRLEGAAGAAAPQSFTATPLRVRAYRGDVTAVLMGMSPRLIDQMRATVPGFRWRGDGRVSYNRQPGYEIVFQARIGGRTTYGRRVLLMPNSETPPREGADIMMLAARSDAVPSLPSIGATGALKTAARSFRFGTERP